MRYWIERRPALFANRMGIRRFDAGEDPLQCIVDVGWRCVFGETGQQILGRSAADPVDRTGQGAQQGLFLQQLSDSLSRDR